MLQISILAAVKIGLSPTIISSRESFLFSRNRLSINWFSKYRVQPLPFKDFHLYLSPLHTLGRSGLDKKGTVASILPRFCILFPQCVLHYYTLHQLYLVSFLKTFLSCLELLSHGILCSKIKTLVRNRSESSQRLHWSESYLKKA